MRVLVVIAEILFIVLAFLYVGLTFGFRYMGEEHFLQQEIRPLIAESELLRKVYGLYGVGDGATSYASKDVIEVVLASDSSKPVDASVEQYLERMIADTVEAQTTVIRVSIDEELASYKDEEVDAVVNELRRAYEADLYVIYLTQLKERPTIIGEAVRDDVVVMYREVLLGLSERQLIRDRLEESTLRHEWGHLLGLEHVDQENCVMSEVVEVFGNKAYQHKNIPVEYCVESVIGIGRL